MYDRDWNPLGLSKNEWMALSSEERVAAYKKHLAKTKRSKRAISPTFNTDRAAGTTWKRSLGMGAGIAATSELKQLLLRMKKPGAVSPRNPAQRI